MIEDKKTILIVDDTETNIDILLELLGNEYDILVALDGEGALEIVHEDSKIDLILLDIMMPNMDGYEVCSILKKNENSQDIPVIFITAKTDEDSIEKAYDVGGIDYITKPFKPRELLARIRTQIKLKALMENLEFIASYDYMTKIYNRRKFFELASKKFDSSKENLYVIMLDIDKFKKINDTYGHPIGDEVIKAVTKKISTFTSPQSVFGRIGGEEFAIVCHATSKENVIKQLEEMRKSIEKIEILASKSEIVKCTISGGISMSNVNTQSLDELLKEADVALYEAKNGGRNRVIFR